MPASVEAVPDDVAEWWNAQFLAGAPYPAMKARAEALWPGRDAGADAVAVMYASVQDAATAPQRPPACPAQAESSAAWVACVEAVLGAVFEIARVEETASWFTTEVVRDVAATGRGIDELSIGEFRALLRQTRARLGLPA